jgi:ABC-type lipoprotein export system ATPase subunit
MIELHNVSKIYPTAEGEVRALDDVSLSIDAGEFVAVRGPSGCGKSTLLALIGGLALPTSGKIVVDGRPIGKMSSAERASFRAESIGFVFQMFHLLPYLSVVDNILVAAPQGADQASRSRAIDLLKTFGLDDRKSHLPSQLSIGERQRVAMARALLNEPQLLLADEPTGNLDEQSAEAVMNWLADFHKGGGTILLVTHEEQAAGYAQRTIALKHGKLDDVKSVAANAAV